MERNELSDSGAPFSALLRPVVVMQKGTKRTTPVHTDRQTDGTYRFTLPPIPPWACMGTERHRLRHRLTPRRNLTFHVVTPFFCA